MVGSGIKKFAGEHGMKVAKGVAYGSLLGYATTISEGSGYKQFVISGKFPDAGKMGELQAAVAQRNVEKEFRVRTLAVSLSGVTVVFADTIGAMKKIRAFVEYFYPLLGEYGVSGVDICPECGMPITKGKWVLVDGTARHFHEACAARVKDRIEAENETRKQEATGSYLTGAVGALGGALLGAVAWAVVLCMNYVASLLGLLIGWLADRGYDLLKGKQGKAKVAILILAIIFGVLAGTLGGYALSFVMLINEGDTGLTYSDIPMLMEILLVEEEYRTDVLSAVLQGLLFAALGVVGVLTQAGKAVSDRKTVDLE